jgi:hypothetical protein
MAEAAAAAYTVRKVCDEQLADLQGRLTPKSLAEVRRLFNVELGWRSTSSEPTGSTARRALPSLAMFGAGLAAKAGAARRRARR